MSAAKRGDGLPRQDDAANRNRHSKHAAGTGGEHSTFAGLLFHHFAVGAQRLQGALGHVEARARLVELGLRDDTGGPQLLHAAEVDLRLLPIGALRLHARVQRLDPKGELGIDDQRHLVAGGDAVAFPHHELGDGAANAGTRLEVAHRLDGGDHRLAVVDLPADDGLLFG